jgi:hypothetical protein
MKLYTEEEVVRAIELSDGRPTDEVLAGLTPIELPSDSLCINCDESKSTHNVCMDCIIKIGRQNIQLPSDEEIEKESFDLYAIHHTYSLNVRQYKAFKGGAKWMRDKIQGGEQ